MTRKQFRRLRLIATLLIVACMAAAYVVLWSTVASASESRMPPCTPQAPNLATRDACHTQTARAGVATATSTLRPSATPTKVTPVATSVELIVFAKVVVKYVDSRGTAQSVDSGIFPWSVNQPVSIQIVRVDNHPQPTATRQATPTSLP